MLYIKNAHILTPNREIERGALLIQKEKIVALGTNEQVPCPDQGTVIDAAGLTVTPGLIDIQLNGGFGLDFTADPATIWAVAAQLPRYGVTAFLPTIITSPLERIAQAQQTILNPPSNFAGALPLGLHIEGPFLNPRKKGAHNADYLRIPDQNIIKNWSPEQAVRLVTLAPELDGALALIRTLVERGVAVSAGHSLAAYAEAQAGFDAGARYGTHLFNAMPALHHREPGLAGALLTDERATAGMIVDGIHIHPKIVKLAWQQLGNTRLNLVTDAMAAMGMPPGRYQLGDYEVTVDQRSARLADGTLAGSILTLDAALGNLVKFTACSFRDALPTVTTVPAKLLGIDAQYGCLAAGYNADLVFFDRDFTVLKTIAGGKLVYDALANQQEGKR